MIKNNTFTIGSIENCGVGVDISGHVEDNKFSIDAIRNCAIGQRTSGAATIQDQLGLPADTDINAIKEALSSLVDTKDTPVKEKEETIKKLPIWEYIKRAGDTTKILKDLIELSNSPHIQMLISQLS